MFFVRPVRSNDTGSAVDPNANGDSTAAVVVHPFSVEDVPQQNDTVVTAKFGFTEPFNDAVVLPIVSAADVVTVGADGFSVLKFRMLPVVVPSEFVAVTRK